MTKPRKHTYKDTPLPPWLIVLLTLTVIISTIITSDLIIVPTQFTSTPITIEHLADVERPAPEGTAPIQIEEIPPRLTTNNTYPMSVMYNIYSHKDELQQIRISYQILDSQGTCIGEGSAEYDTCPPYTATVFLHKGWNSFIVSLRPYHLIVHQNYTVIRQIIVGDLESQLNYEWIKP